MRFAWSLGLSLLAASTLAQVDFSDSNLFPNSNRNIARPELIMGTQLTSRHIRSHEVNEYFRLVAEQSDRVQYFAYGRSHQDRPIPYAIVSSPENLRRLDEIKSQNRKLFTDPDSLSQSDLEDMPGILWMGYGVHGNEASVTEAAVMTLYRLAACNDPLTKEALDKTIILVLPDYNPDGRARFVEWVNGMRGETATEHPADVEHRSPWPGGRTNHYWFDLNRDWLPLSQPESVSRHAIWTEWRPQITLDYHEMGSSSTYFFQPGVPSRTNPNTPQENQDITGEIARFYAKALEKRNETYFTKERFDDYYIGKGSTYPDVSGSIGILFEQASSRALVVQTPSRLLDFRTTVLNQYATSVASLEAAVANRVKLLDYQKRFYSEAYNGRFAALEVPVADAPERVYGLGQLLQKHDIVVQLVEKRNQEFLRIPYDQTLWRLVQAMFARPTTFDDDQFYDVSAWTLDFAIGAPGEEVTMLTGTVQENPDFDAKINSLGAAPANVDNTVGFVIDGSSDRAFTATFHLQKAGFQTYVVTDELGDTAKPGDIFIPVSGVEEDVVLADLLTIAAERWQIRSTAIEGQTGEVVSWGGGSTRLMPKLNIGLVVGDGMSSNDSGEVWHLLDHTWGLKVSLIDSQSLASSDLDRFTHIILAGGSPSAASRSALGTWVTMGGTLIGTNTSATTVASIAGWSLETRRFSPDLTGVPYGDLGEVRTRHGLPGSIFQATFDQTHPLAFNLPETLPMFREGTSFIVPPTQAGTVVGTYTPNPLLAGYVSDEVLDTAREAAVFLARGAGRGKIIVIADNTNFRAFFTGPNRLLGNAIFYSEAF